MNKSESIKHLATALGKAQAEMSAAKKSAKNPFFKSKYANLEEVIHCIKEPFADNGLSFVQFPVAEDGMAGVETILMHESGEWISGVFMLKCSKNDPQGMGSAITYARRYGLQSAVGVPSEDDDGAGATQRSKPKSESDKVNANPITTPQIEAINSLRALAGLTADRLAAGIKKASAGYASTVDKLSEHEAIKLIGMLNQIIETEK
tara:strand:+ start:1504 stop:2121 length:618 start_codon:yes stop_codon:yes gene_type:complete